MSRNSGFVVVALALSGALAAVAAHAQERRPAQVAVAIGAPGYSQVAQVVVRPVVVRAPRHYRHPTRWDRDGDGIPNRYDRRYNPRRDRDGDGIPNRHDRYDNRRR
jgi:hypothetical protein